MAANTLLICTVGGSPEPLAASIKKCQPSRIVFVPSSETVRMIEEEIIPLLALESMALDGGRYDTVVMTDGQDFSQCVLRMKCITPLVNAWLSRGETYNVVVDFTGGTKCMGAALTLHAHRWRCSFAYVGGQERTKEGVGVVVSGKEIVFQSLNPWEALGFQAVDDFVQLFDEGAFASASRLATAVMRQVEHPARKRELNALSCLAKAYEEWDRFNHKQASSHLQDVQRNANDLTSVLGNAAVSQRLEEIVTAHCEVLIRLRQPDPGALVLDLLANASRRANEGRWDDATARLYRAIEATAQVRLSDRYQVVSTKRIPLAMLPAGLREEWGGRISDGFFMAGLQDAYRLLHQMGDPLGRRFIELGLAERKGSPLSGRNDSILAHGFAPVGEKLCRTLWSCALQLADVSEEDLWSFPILSALTH